MTNTDYENPISNKMQELSKIGSEIRNTFMLGQKLSSDGKEIIDLSIGNPDLEPPLLVKEKIKELMHSNDDGAHRYMDAAGLLNVRNFLSSTLSQSEGVSISDQNVYLTVGAAGALQICMRAFLSAGDEVIVFQPYFPEYLSYTHHLYATPVIVHSDENHLPILEDFEKKITTRTKLVILNTPNNPSGVYYSQAHLEKIFSILINANKRLNKMIPVLSDEPYMRLLYVEPNDSMLKLYPHTFLIRSLSKDLGLSGERIGYFTWREDIFDNSTFSRDLINVFRNAARVSGFVSAPRLMQRLIPYIFDQKVDIQVYQKRIDLFISYLQKYNIPCVKPQAGFFVFPKVANQMNDVDFCTYLANKGLLCVPGSAFGKPGYVRASLSQDILKIEAAASIYVQ